MVEFIIFIFVVLLLIGVLEVEPRQERVDYKTYINSERWRSISLLKKAHARNKCERCGSIEHLNAHHINYKNLGREQLTDLVCCCEDCHLNFFHGDDIKAIRTWLRNNGYESRNVYTRKSGTANISSMLEIK